MARRAAVGRKSSPAPLHLSCSRLRLKSLREWPKWRRGRLDVDGGAHCGNVDTTKDVVVAEDVTQVDEVSDP